MTHVDEACVQAWHELAHLGEIYVAHVEACLLLLFLVFDESLILGQGNGNLLWLYVDNYFTSHECDFGLVFLRACARYINFKTRNKPSQSKGVICSSL